MRVVGGRIAAGRDAIPPLRMYFRFDNSIFAAPTQSDLAESAMSSGKNNPRRLRRAPRRFIYVYNTQRRTPCISLVEEKRKKKKQGTR